MTTDLTTVGPAPSPPVDEASRRVFGDYVPPPRPTARRGPLRWSLWLVLALAATLAVAEAFLAAATYPDHAVTVAAYPVVGLAFVAVGCVASIRRPSNRTGVLLTVTGALIMVAALGNVGEPDIGRIGVLAGQLPIAAFLHLVLAFPAGRVRGRIDLGLVVVGYLLLVTLQLSAAFPSLTALDVPTGSSVALGVAVVVAAALRVAVRVVRTQPRAERRVLISVYGYGIAQLLFFPFSARVLAPWIDLDAFELFSLQIGVLVVAPFVFAAGILRGGFGRTGELTELTGWLGAQGAGRGSLRDALAVVLGDPSLQVLFARPGDDDAVDALIDADGRPAVVGPVHERGLVRVDDGDGGIAATLVYDRSLSDDASVQQAGRVVALALERERLQAELLAEREALRASRTRVVEVGDQQRRQLAQDLHDVLQSRLTLAALKAGTLAADSTEPTTRRGAEQLRLELDGLITEFRAMVHGVMPALLVERGLAAAAEDLVDRQPVTARLHIAGADDLPPMIATTAYFILAEALTNAVRHGRATRLDVVVEQHEAELRLEVRDDGIGGASPTGAGLRGIADRVEALDGRWHIDSPTGAGTRLAVVLPCAS